MNLQLFVTASEALRPKVTPVRNRPESAWPKPAGGLWTSTWRPASADSAWVEWSRTYLTGGSQDPDWLFWWLLFPDPAARLLVINGRDDLWAILDRWSIRGQGRRLPDFERISQNFDGMHLTEQGQRETHTLFPCSDDLYGWDCECTLWFRWRFGKFTCIRRPATEEESRRKPMPQDAHEHAMTEARGKEALDLQGHGWIV